jgi:polyhydroxyalkanoate synthesis regulator phasin
MPQRPDLTRFIDAGADFVALTRAQARGRAKVLVDQGVLAQSQVQGFVDGIVDESRRRRDAAVGLVRNEVARQVKALGLVTRDELAASERRLRRELSTSKAKAKATKTAKASKSTKATTAAPKKAAAKKAAAKKSAAKKAAKRSR